MAWPSSLQVALKEWAVVCHALETGPQIILLRKGGIVEARHGFAPEHREFLLFPTYLHQNERMLKPAVHEQLRAAQRTVAEKQPGPVAASAPSTSAVPPAHEPSEVSVFVAGVVSDVVQVRSRAQIDAWDQEHVWTAPLIDMRFDYRPKNPLYLLLVRAYRLAEPIALANTPAYAGCKSWVPLDQPIETGGAVPVLDDVRYEAKRANVLKAMG